VVDLIVIDSDKSSAIAQIRFDELSPRNQSERLRVILSDYLFTVMSRAETMHLDGLVLDFAQKLGPTNKLRIVARIGMSRHHAKKFLIELGKLVAMTEGQLQTNKPKN